MEREEALETTLWDFIVRLTEEATASAHNDEEAYKVVAFALVRLLYNSGMTAKVYQTWH